MLFRCTPYVTMYLYPGGGEWPMQCKVDPSGKMSTTLLMFDVWSWWWCLKAAYYNQEMLPPVGQWKKEKKKGLLDSERYYYYYQKYKPYRISIMTSHGEWSGSTPPPIRGVWFAKTRETGCCPPTDDRWYIISACGPSSQGPSVFSLFRGSDLFPASRPRWTVR